MKHDLPSALCLLAALSCVPALAGGPAETQAAAFQDALSGKPGGFAALSAKPLSREAEKAERAAQWEAYRAAAVQLGWDKNPVAWPGEPGAQLKRNGQPMRLTAGVLPCAPETMPYALLTKGDKPEGRGWPLFFQTHGGGGTDEKLSGPHGWEVNSQDWRAQTQIIPMLFPPGRYFVPRMANDNKGRWWYKHNLAAFDAVIRRGTLFHGVDPDRVYMMGISEGAYGTEAILPFWADHFAGGCAMAGGAGGGERHLSLRSTPLRSDTGEHDTMFGRIKLVQDEHAWIEKYRQADPQGYEHSLGIQKGRGHAIDYAPGPAWIATKVRDPRPAKVVWFNHELDGLRRTDFYWLALSKAPARDALIEAQVDKQTNAVTVKAVMNPPEAKSESPVYGAKPPEVGARVPLAGLELIVHLDDALLDLDKEVTVVVNGKQAFKGKVARSARVLAETLANTGDPGRTFSGEVRVKME